jgi:hypothetical protein
VIMGALLIVVVGAPLLIERWRNGSRFSSG